MLPENAEIFLVHADRIAYYLRLPLSIVDDRIKIVYFSQAVTAKDKAIGKHTNANLSCIENVFEVVRGRRVPVWHIHFGERRTIENGAPPFLVEILHQVQYESLTWSKAGAEAPLLPGHLLSLNLEARAFWLRDRDRFQVRAWALWERGHILR